MDPNPPVAWRRRTIALGLGAALSALLALAAWAAFPTGGHDYLLGMASWLGTAIGSLGCAVFAVLLGVHAVRWLVAGRPKRPF